jgi:uncharacterized Zn finger protein (UPF0148 family)
MSVQCKKCGEESPLVELVTTGKVIEVVCGVCGHHERL